MSEVKNKTKKVIFFARGGLAGRLKFKGKTIGVSLLQGWRETRDLPGFTLAVKSQSVYTVGRHRVAQNRFFG